MKKRALLPAFAALLLLLLTGAGDSRQEGLLWPARAQPGVTSAFGDWRPGHVHAGADVKTWGRVGVPMLAVTDGFIRRVRTSPWGYGKALYLQLADGRMAVYGHLDRFTPELDDRVIDRQLDERTWSVDLWFERDEYPVSRGDVIAYSGMTGTTAPHLHFEMRNEANEPVNPLTSGLEIVDTISPIISYLLVRPVGPASRLEGDIRVRRFGLQSTGRRSYRLRGRPVIEGTAVLAVSTYDMMDGVWNRFGPYRLALEVDGIERFATAYDRFAYENTGQIALDRDYRYMVRQGARAHTLYRQRGNELAFYGSYGVGEGYLTLQPGVHEIRISVSDAMGNETTLTGELLVNSPPLLSWDRNGAQAVERIRPLTGDRAVTVDRPLPPTGRIVDPDGDSITLAVEVRPLDGAFPGDQPRAVPERGADEPSLPRWQVLEAAAVRRAGGLFTLTATILDSLHRIGPQALRVRARDSWGSEVVSDPVLVGHPGHASGSPGAVPAGESAIALSIDRYERFLILTARVDDPVPGQMLFTVRQGDCDPIHLHGTPENGDRYRAVYPLQRSTGEMVAISARWENVFGVRCEAGGVRRIITLPANGEAVLRSEATGFTVSFGPGAVYEDAWFEETGTETAISNGDQGLVALSAVTLLGPEDILFRDGGEVSIPLDSLPAGIESRQVGLYTRGEREESGNGEGTRWFYLGGELRGGVLRADLGGLGPLAAMADTTRPVITLVSPRDSSTVRAGRPQIVYEIEDNATGFSDERQLVLRLNGTLLIAHYDAQRDRLVYTPRDPLEPGEYFMILEATDGAGNTARHRSRFTVR